MTTCNTLSMKSTRKIKKNKFNNMENNFLFHTSASNYINTLYLLYT